jgi:hypothetical protein
MRGCCVGGRQEEHEHAEREDRCAQQHPAAAAAHLPTRVITCITNQRVDNEVCEACDQQDRADCFDADLEIVSVEFRHEDGDGQARESERHGQLSETQYCQPGEPVFRLAVFRGTLQRQHSRRSSAVLVWLDRMINESG